MPHLHYEISTICNFSNVEMVSKSTVESFVDLTQFCFNLYPMGGGFSWWLKRNSFVWGSHSNNQVSTLQFIRTARWKLDRREFTELCFVPFFHAERFCMQFNSLMVLVTFWAVVWIITCSAPNVPIEHLCLWLNVKQPDSETEVQFMVENEQESKK